MLNVLSVIGTRPEAVKMAPVVAELAAQRGRVRSIVCVTGQHRRMLDQVLEVFRIRPDVDLDVMRPDQSLAQVTASLIAGLDAVVARERPDWVLAQGDTASVLAASLVAYYRQVRFGHVEAGLRTGDLMRPFPEEGNRRIADALAGLLFAPTPASAATLRSEGHPADQIVVTGNTSIDALRLAADLPYDWRRGPLAALPEGRRLVLVTAHRRESFGEPIRRICGAVRELAEGHRGAGVHFVFPVHLNPNVGVPVSEILSGIPNVSLVDPLDYLAMVHLMRRVELILSDSGGIQEEAAGLRVPLLVLRETTERTEGIERGLVRLVGTQRRRIVDEASGLLRDRSARQAMTVGENPYGDGFASGRIVQALLRAG